MNEVLKLLNEAAEQLLKKDENKIIKRELHTGITNKDIEEILENMTDETKIVSHVVDGVGTHYIITETEVQEHDELLQSKETYYIRCDYRGDYQFTKNKEYEIFESDHGLFTVDDHGVPTTAPQKTPELLKTALNYKYVSSFSLLKIK